MLFSSSWFWCCCCWNGEGHIVTLLARLCGIRESLPVSLAAEDGWSDMLYDDLVFGIWYLVFGIWYLLVR
jgi:hypothetical protein